MLELPSPPRVRLAEFTRRYAAAEAMARRYAAAVQAAEGTPEYERLAAEWPTVLAMLDKVCKACEVGARTSARAKRRRKGSPRAVKLHQVHVALVALEKAVDAAVAAAVIALLDATGPTASRRAEADEWLCALTSALNELEHSVVWIADEGSDP
ncbi:MAG TPA: hypothetical protein VFC00_00600 [Micromonosporaceae bacterium]|nr:hypothetical protein [Micromonosporaceae bacterium]